MEELGPQPRFSQLASTESRKPLLFPLGRPHSGGPVGQGQHNSAYTGQIHRLGKCGRNRQGTLFSGRPSPWSSVLPILVQTHSPNLLGS